MDKLMTCSESGFVLNWLLPSAVHSIIDSMSIYNCWALNISEVLMCLLPIMLHWIWRLQFCNLAEESYFCDMQINFIKHTINIWSVFWFPIYAVNLLSVAMQNHGTVLFILLGNPFCNHAAVSFLHLLRNWKLQHVMYISSVNHTVTFQSLEETQMN